MDVSIVRERVRDNLRTNLNKLMKQRKMKQAELARLMGVSAPTVNDWMKGRKVPRMDKIDKLCSIFSITRSDLLDEKKHIEITVPVDASRPYIDAQTKEHLRVYLSLSKEDRSKVDEYAEMLAQKARDAAQDSASSAEGKSEYA